MTTNYSLYNKNIFNKTPISNHTKSYFGFTANNFNKNNLRTSYFNSNKLVKALKKDDLSLNNVFRIKIPKDIKELSFRINNRYSIPSIDNIIKDKSYKSQSTKLKVRYTKPISIVNTDFNKIKQDIKAKVLNIKLKLNPIQIKKYKLIENAVLEDVCKLDQFESSKIILDLINSFQKCDKKVILTSGMSSISEKSNKIKYCKLSNPVLTVNPLINYQKIIEDSEILYLFHNDNTRKMKERKEISFDF